MVYKNPIDKNCPYKPRNPIWALILTISFYWYMEAMWSDIKEKDKEQAKKDRCYPTLKNAYHMARSGWK